MKNFFKGFAVGIGKIIPGVSGAMIAISLGIYDKAVNYINNFNNNKKESIKFLVPIGVGIILSIVFFSKIISFCLNSYYIITMLFFVGLIIGGLPGVLKSVNRKDIYISVISFLLFFLISIGNMANIYVIKNNVIDIGVFFLSGVIEAIGSIVPGISSTALLMIMGTYNIVITAIGNLSDFYILIPFGIGFIIGMVAIVKIISWLFNRCENKVYAFVLGVLMSSIVLLVIQSFKYGVILSELVIGIIFMLLGIFLSSVLKEK